MREITMMISLRIPVFLDLEDMLLEPELTPKLAEEYIIIRRLVNM